MRVSTVKIMATPECVPRKSGGVKQVTGWSLWGFRLSNSSKTEYPSYKIGSNGLCSRKHVTKKMQLRTQDRILVPGRLSLIYVRQIV